jgi:hypothetical protein
MLADGTPVWIFIFIGLDCAIATPDNANDKTANVKKRFVNLISISISSSLMGQVFFVNTIFRQYMIQSNGTRCFYLGEKHY